MTALKIIGGIVLWAIVATYIERVMWPAWRRWRLRRKIERRIYKGEPR